jgi:hypothetical protein
MRTEETMGEKPLRIKLRRAGQKLVRLDRPGDLEEGAEAREEAVGGNGRLIDLILKAIRANPADRRRDFRHDAVEHEVWVGWWTRDDFGAVPGYLLNISRGGAQIVLDCRPPRKRAVWVYKDIGSTLATVSAQVAGHTPAPGGAYCVRFRFASPCPTVLSRSVLCPETPAWAPGPGGQT